MNYLLNTNIVVYLYAPDSLFHKKVLQHIIIEHSYSISVLTLFEMAYSLANAPESKKAEISNNIQSLKNRFTILPLQDRYTENYGRMKGLTLNQTFKNQSKGKQCPLTQERKCSQFKLENGTL